MFGLFSVTIKCIRKLLQWLRVTATKHAHMLQFIVYNASIIQAQREMDLLNIFFFIWDLLSFRSVSRAVNECSGKEAKITTTTRINNKLKSIGNHTVHPAARHSQSKTAKHHLRIYIMDWIEASWYGAAYSYYCHNYCARDAMNGTENECISISNTNFIFTFLFWDFSAQIMQRIWKKNMWKVLWVYKFNILAIKMYSFQWHGLLKQ